MLVDYVCTRRRVPRRAATFRSEKNPMRPGLTGYQVRPTRMDDKWHQQFQGGGASHGARPEGLPGDSKWRCPGHRTVRCRFNSVDSVTESWLLFPGYKRPLMAIDVLDRW